MLKQITKGITLSLISLLALGVSSANAIDIAVSPPRVELEIGNNKTRTQTIKIVNFSSKPAEIKAYVHSWTTNENNDIQVVPSNEQSLDQWIVFTPAKFTIPPKSSQIIRFAIRPKVKPTSGEHRAVLYLEEIPPDSESARGVITVARVGIAIYGYAGDIKRSGVINSVSVNHQKKTAIFDVSSTGNAHVRMRGQYTIWPADKYPGASTTQPINNLGNPQTKLPANVLDAGYMELDPVLPDTRRQVSMPINKKLPPGNYVLDINASLSGQPVDKGFPFTVPGTSATVKPATKPNTSSNR